MGEDKKIAKDAAAKSIAADQAKTAEAAKLEAVKQEGKAAKKLTTANSPVDKAIATKELAIAKAESKSEDNKIKVAEKKEKAQIPIPQTIVPSEAARQKERQEVKAKVAKEVAKEKNSLKKDMAAAKAENAEGKTMRRRQTKKRKRPRT